PDFDPTQISIRWTVAGWGNDYAAPLPDAQNLKPVDDRPLPYLNRPVDVYFDG
ncbi:hypothetical protein FRC01_007387, partial [Tulasnella sp. 417]